MHLVDAYYVIYRPVDDVFILLPVGTNNALHSTVHAQYCTVTVSNALLKFYF